MFDGSCRSRWLVVVLSPLGSLALADCPIARLAAPPGDAAPFENFAGSVAMDGARIAVGCRYDNASNLTGAVYAFRLVDQTWTLDRKLIASDGAALDLLGRTCDVSGDRVIAGAYLANVAGWADAGAAYVFHAVDGAWQEHKLAASDPGYREWFGWDVAIEDDYAIVGARRDLGEEGLIPPGAAYVFFWDGGAWSQQAKLRAADPDPNDAFGDAVAISGERAVIGAGQDSEGGYRAGAAYVFTRDGNAWSENAKLLAADADPNDHFGSALALDGDVLAIGAPNDDRLRRNEGAVYVFRHSGAAWTQEAKLVASDAAMDDRFGSSVDLHGNRLIVGARADDDAGPSSGSAYVFEHDGASWVEILKLAAPDGAAGDHFGVSVAVQEDRALVGAWQEDDPAGGVDAGAAHVFAIDGPDCNTNGAIDACDIAAGLSEDVNANGVPDECEPCPGDLDGDRQVSLADLSMLLTNYGLTNGATPEQGDLDGDGDIDLSDLAALLSAFGSSCL